MELDYSEIFTVLTNIIVAALPISFFLHLTTIGISLFFSLAFPKFYSKGD